MGNRTYEQFITDIIMNNSDLILTNSENKFIEESDRTTQEERYQFQSNNILSDDKVDKENEVASSVPNKVKVNGKSRYPRDPAIAANALKVANYQCEHDHSHVTFTHGNKSHQYVEAHHLIPISKQHEFEHSIDKVSNIVSLCPNCHRAIHFGDYITKKEMIDTLFNRYQFLLSNIRINVKIEKLYKYYNIL